VIMERFRVDGRVAVVTGAGRGIGAASAVALAQAGADVVVSSRTEDQLRKVAAGIEAAGRRALVVPSDLSDPEAAAALAGRAADAFGRLDIVVNNMGGALPRPFLDTKPRHLENAFQFNVSSTHALTRAAVPHLLEHGGSVVNVSSVMGRITGRGYLAYGTAKAALAHYTRLAALDLAPKIRVNAVAVGSDGTTTRLA
jgi:7-alpha-hydroxysteroid dehydrogenase